MLSNIGRKTVKKINELVKDISRDPSFSGFWSRRISDEHRMVYRVQEGVIELAQLRYHY